jgi:hypothetical protein
MEGAMVRRFAESLGVPFFHLRAISDGATDAVDPSIVEFIDDFGAVRPVHLAAAIFKRPCLLRHLIRLGSNTKIAGASLQEEMRRWCAFRADASIPT